MPIDNFENIDEIDKALLRKDYINKQINDNRNSNSNINSNSNNSIKNNTNLFDEVFSHKTEENFNVEDNSNNVIDNIFNNDSEIDNVFSSINQTPINNLQEENQLQSQNTSSNVNPNQTNKTSPDSNPPIKNDENNVNQSTKGQTNQDNLYSPEEFEELERSRGGLKDFVLPSAQRRLKAETEAYNKNADILAERAKSEHAYQLDRQLLKEKQMIDAIGQVASLAEMKSGLAEEQAYRNYLVSKGALDKGLADYYTFQENQRVKYAKNDFDLTIKVPLEQNLQEHRLYNAYEKQRFAAQVELAKEKNKILTEIARNQAAIQQYSLNIVYDDYDTLLRNSARNMFVSQDLSLLNSTNNFWDLMKSGWNSLYYNKIKPLFEELQWSGNEVFHMVFDPVTPKNERKTTFEERWEIHKDQVIKNALMGKMGGAISSTYSYEDMLNLAGTGDGFSKSQFAKRMFYDTVQSLPELAAIAAIDFLSRGIGGKLLAGLGATGQRLAMVAQANNAIKLGTTFKNAGTWGTFLAKTASKILSNPKYNSIATFIVLDSIFEYNGFRNQKLLNLLEQGLNPNQAFVESELTLFEHSMLVGYSLLNKAELIPLVSLLTKTIPDIPGFKQLSTRLLENKMFKGSLIPTQLLGTAFFEGITEGLQGLTEEYGANDHYALEREIDNWNVFAENFWGGFGGGVILGSAAKTIGEARGFLFSRGNQEGPITANTLGINSRSAHASGLLNALNNTSHESRNIFQSLYQNASELINIDNLVNNNFSEDQDFEREVNLDRDSYQPTNTIGRLYTRFQTSNGSIDEMNSVIDNDINNAQNKQNTLQEELKELQRQRSEAKKIGEETTEIDKKISDKKKEISNIIFEKNQAKIHKALINNNQSKASLQALFVYMNYTNNNQVNISEANQETLKRLIDKAKNNPEAFTEQDLQTIKDILKDSNVNNVNPNINTTTSQNTNTDTTNNTNNNNNNDDNNGGNPPNTPPTNVNTNEVGDSSSTTNSKEEANDEEDDDEYDDRFVNWAYIAEEARKRKEEARKKTLPAKARVKVAKLTKEQWESLSQEQKDKYIEEYIEKYEKNNNNSKKDNTSSTNNNRRGSSENRYKNNDKTSTSNKTNQYGFTKEEWDSLSKEDREAIIVEEEASKREEEASKREEEDRKKKTNTKNKAIKTKNNNKINKKEAKRKPYTQKISENIDNKTPDDKLDINEEEIRQERQQAINTSTKVGITSEKKNEGYNALILSIFKPLFKNIDETYFFSLLEKIINNIRQYKIFDKKYRSVTLDFETSKILTDNNGKKYVKRVDCVVVMDNLTLEKNIYVSKNIIQNIINSYKKNNKNISEKQVLSLLSKKYNTEVKILEDDFKDDISQYGKVIAHNGDFDVNTIMRDKYGIDIDYADTMIAQQYFGTENAQLNTLADKVGEKKGEYKDTFPEPTTLEELMELLDYNIQDVNVTYKLAMNLFYKANNIAFAPTTTLPALIIYVAQQSQIENNTDNIEKANKLKDIFNNFIINIFKKINPYIKNNTITLTPSEIIHQILVFYSNAENNNNINKSFDTKFIKNPDEIFGIEENQLKNYNNEMPKYYKNSKFYDFFNSNLMRRLLLVIFDRTINKKTINQISLNYLRNLMHNRLNELGIEDKDFNTSNILINQIITEASKASDITDLSLFIQNITNQAYYLVAQELNINLNEEAELEIESDYISKIKNPNIRNDLHKVQISLKNLKDMINNNVDKKLIKEQIKSIIKNIIELKSSLTILINNLNENPYNVIDALLQLIKEIPFNELNTISWRYKNFIIKAIADNIVKIVNNNDIKKEIHIKDAQNNINTIKIELNNEQAINIATGMSIIPRDKIRKIIKRIFIRNINLPNGIKLPLDNTLKEALENNNEDIIETYIDRYELFFTTFISALLSSIARADTFTGGVYNNQITLEQILDSVTSILGRVQEDNISQKSVFRDENGKEAFSNEMIQQMASSVLDILKEEFTILDDKLINTHTRYDGKIFVDISEEFYRLYKQYFLDVFKKPSINENSVNTANRVLNKKESKLESLKKKIKDKFKVKEKNKQPIIKQIYDNIILKFKDITKGMKPHQVWSRVPKKIDYRRAFNLLYNWGATNIEEISKEEYDKIRAKAIKDDNEESFRNALNLFSCTIDGETKYYKGDFKLTNLEPYSEFPTKRVEALDKYSNMNRVMFFYYTILDRKFKAKSKDHYLNPRVYNLKNLPTWHKLNHIVDIFIKDDGIFFTKYYSTPNSNMRSYSEIALFSGQQLPIFRGLMVNAFDDYLTKEEISIEGNPALEYIIMEALGLDYSKPNDNRISEKLVADIKDKILKQEFKTLTELIDYINQEMRKLTNNYQDIITPDTLIDESQKNKVDVKDVVKRYESLYVLYEISNDVYVNGIPSYMNMQIDGISMGFTLGLFQNLDSPLNRALLQLCGIKVQVRDLNSNIIEEMENDTNKVIEEELSDYIYNDQKIHNYIGDKILNAIKELLNIEDNSKNQLLIFIKYLVEKNKKDFGKLFTQPITYNGGIKTALKHMLSDIDFADFISTKKIDFKKIINHFNNIKTEGELEYINEGIEKTFLAEGITREFLSQVIDEQYITPELIEYMNNILFSNLLSKEDVGGLTEAKLKYIIYERLENLKDNIADTLLDPMINVNNDIEDITHILRDLKESNSELLYMINTIIFSKIELILHKTNIKNNLLALEEISNKDKKEYTNDELFQIDYIANQLILEFEEAFKDGINIHIPLSRINNEVTINITLLNKTKNYDDSIDNKDNDKKTKSLLNVIGNIMGGHKFTLLSDIKVEGKKLKVNQTLQELKHKLSFPIVGPLLGQIVESVVFSEVAREHPDMVGIQVYDSVYASPKNIDTIARTANRIIGENALDLINGIYHGIRAEANKWYKEANQKLIKMNHNQKEDIRLIGEKLVDQEQNLYGDSFKQNIKKRMNNAKNLANSPIRNIEYDEIPFEINNLRTRSKSTSSNVNIKNNNYIKENKDKKPIYQGDEISTLENTFTEKRRGSSENRYKDDTQNNESEQQYDGYNKQAGNLTKLSYEQQISALEEQKQKAQAIGDDSLVETIEKEIKFLRDLHFQGVEVEVYIGDNIQDTQGEIDLDTNKIYIGGGKDAFAHELGHYITDTVDKYDHMPEIAKVKQEFTSLYERVQEIYAKLYEKFNGDKEKIAEVMGISVEKLDYIFNSENGLSEFIQHAMTDVNFAKWLNKVKVRTQNNKPANLFQRLLRAITNFFRMMSKNPTILEAMQKNFTKAIEIKLLTQKAESLVDSKAYISENYEAIVQRIMSEAYGNNINTAEGYIRQGYQKAGKIISDYVDGKITTRQFWDRMYIEVGYGALIIIANTANINLLTSKKPILRAIGKFTQSLLFDSNLLLNTKTSNEFLNAFISDSIVKKQIGRDVNRVVSIYKEVAETIVRNSGINSDSQDIINKFIIKDKIFMAFDGLKTIEEKQKMLEMINSILTKDNSDISDITSDITHKIETIINSLKLDKNLKKQISQFIINSSKEDLSRAFILKQRIGITYVPSARGLLSYININILNTNKIINNDVISKLSPLINQLVVLNGIALNTSYDTKMKQSLSNLLTNTETNTNRKNSFKSTMFNITDLTYKAFDNNRSAYYDRYDFSYSENINNNVSFEYTANYKNAKRLLQLGYTMQIVDDRGNLKEIKELPENVNLFNKLVARTDKNYKKFNLPMNNKGGIIFKKNNFYSESFELLEIDVDNQVLFKGNIGRDEYNNQWHQAFFSARTNPKYKNRNKQFHNIKESLALRRAMFRDNGRLRGIRKITQQKNSIENSIGDIVYRNSSNSIIEETTNSRFEAIKTYTDKVKKEKISPKLSVVIYDKNWSKEKKQKELSKRFSKTELVILNQQGFFDHQDKLYIPIEAESVIQAKWKSAIVYKWMKDSDNKILNYTYRLTRMSHEFLKKMTGELKTTITERFPNVIFGNILFNTISMFSLGMSPKQIYQYNKEAFDSITQYVDASHRLSDIQQKLLQIQDTSSITYEALKIQEKALQQKINSNMIHKYRGLQTNISEESSRSDLVNNVIDNLIDINRIKKGADILLFTRRSPQFKFFSQVNLWGDVMGRLALFNYYAKERNMNINNAINESNRFFVDYNKPFTNVILRLADELGLSMFIRYNTNMKGVIAEGLANPRTRINNMILLGLYMFGTAGFDQTIYHTILSQGYNIWAGKGLYNSLNRWAGLQRVVG